MFLSKSIILFFITIFSTKILCQQWSPVGMHGGGFITQITPHPKNADIWVGCVDIGHAYITKNNGENWQPLFKSMPKIAKDNFATRSFAFHPTDANKMYFVTGRGNGSTYSNLWATDNEGLNYDSESLPINIDANDEGRWGGTTLLVRQKNDVDEILIAGQTRANSAGSLIGNGGIAMKTGNNSIVKLATTFFDNSNITKIAFSKTNLDEIIISCIDITRNNAGSATENQGLYKLNLQTLAISSLVTHMPIYDFDFDGINPNLLVFTSLTGVYKYDLSSLTLSALNFPPIDGNQIDAYGQFVSCHPKIENRWYIGSYKFNQSIILFTNDAGDTFKKVRYKAGQINATEKLDYTADFVANNEKYHFGNQMAGIVFSPVNSSRAMISDYNTPWITENANTDFVKPTGTDFNNNANWTWRMVANGIHNLAGIRLSFNEYNNQEMTSNIADHAYYKTLNTGNSMIFNNNYTAISPSNLYLNMTTKTIWDNANNKVYMAGCKQHGAGGRVEVSIDNGANWTDPSLPANILFQNSKVVTDLQLVNGSLIIGIEKNIGSIYTDYVLRSDDGGGTWYNWGTSLPPVAANGLPFRLWEKNNHLLKDKDGQTLYIFYNQELWKRGINEASWSKITLPNASNILSIAVSRINTGELFVSFNNNSFYKLNQANGMAQAKVLAPIWTSIVGPAGYKIISTAINSENKMVVITDEILASNTPQKVFLSADVLNSQNPFWTEVSQSNLWGMLSSVEFINDTEIMALSDGIGTFKLSLANNPLPIELVNFKGRAIGNAVELTWETSPESDFSFIEIEKSIDGKIFKTIATINKNIEAIRYGYLDENLNSSENNYYRLKIKVNNGKPIFSKIIYLELKDDFVIIGDIYPNPSNSNESSIDIKVSKNENWTFTLFDFYGKQLQDEVKMLKIGTNTIKLNTKKGFNYYKIQNNSHIYIRKLIGF